MTFSLFGDKFTRHSGITLLMEDLNDGLRTPGAIMLGGGNPAQIPEMQDYFQTLLTDMLESGKATDALCNYDGPQGKTELLTLLAGMLREKLGWDIEPQNIALTNGSQEGVSENRRRVSWRMSPYCCDFRQFASDKPDKTHP